MMMIIYKGKGLYQGPTILIVLAMFAWIKYVEIHSEMCSTKELLMKWEVKDIK